MPPAAMPIAGVYTWDPHLQAGLYSRLGWNTCLGPYPARPPAYYSPTVMPTGPLLCTRHCASFLESFFS